MATDQHVQPTVVLPGYTVYRDAETHRFHVRAEATGKTVGIHVDLVAKLAICEGAEYMRGLPRNTHLDAHVEKLKQRDTWESELSAAAVLAVNGKIHGLMPDEYPVPMGEYRDAGAKAAIARAAYEKAAREADAAWEAVVEKARSLPQFEGMSIVTGKGLACLESPIGVCLYDTIDEDCWERCVVCGLPEDRGT